MEFCGGGWSYLCPIFCMVLWSDRDTNTICDLSSITPIWHYSTFLRDKGKKIWGGCEGWYFNVLCIYWLGGLGLSYSYLNVLGLFKVRCGWLSDQMLHRSLSTLYTVWGGLCLINTLGEGRCGRLHTGMMSIIVRVLILCVDTRLCRSLQSHFNDSFIHLMSRVISRLPSLLYYVRAT